MKGAALGLGIPGSVLGQFGHQFGSVDVNHASCTDSSSSKYLYSCYIPGGAHVGLQLFTWQIMP